MTPSSKARIHAVERSGVRLDKLISPRREMSISAGMLLLTVTAVVFLAVDMLAVGQRLWQEGSSLGLIQLAVFSSLVGALIYGGLVYQATRIGYLARVSASDPVTDESRTVTPDGVAVDRYPRVAVLVPSYREEPDVVRQTILSAALQEYPNISVALLIDDPPNAVGDTESAQLDGARQMPAEIAAMVGPIETMVGAASAEFSRRMSNSQLESIDQEAVRLAELYRRAASTVEGLSRTGVDTGATHTDVLFHNQVIDRAAGRLRARADALTSTDHQLKTYTEVDSEYRWLASVFHVEVTSFERKRFANLSHEPNKAMNLNSYISLLGGNWKVDATEQGRLLVDAATDPDIRIPDVDYVVTLDADSVIVPEYVATLVGILEQPDNSRVAVAQTPYSAVPGAPSRLERVAGATTDIQYISHQGFTVFGATYWVGANAVIRKSALLDIEEAVIERGYEVKRYVHDRTVIEDTESSVDLLQNGWSLHNHPQRLSYSATPPDFGSLVVQRQRWANGGLIILPKLLRYRWGQRRRSIRWMVDSLVHAHYLISIAAVNVALLALLLVPFSAAFMSIWLPLTAAGYFYIYARDLSQNGYGYLDVVRVYALNLVLLPVNLAGVLKSVEQGITRRKIPFARTPKVDGRTATPARYLLAILILMAAWVLGSASDLTGSRVVLGLFALANAAMLAYGTWAFIGWRTLTEDLRAQLSPWERLRRAVDRLPRVATDQP